MSAHHLSSLTIIWSGALLLLAFTSTLPAAVITVTDPTGTAGTDVNTAGRTFASTHGNVSLASLNANPDQFTIPFDNTSEFTNPFVDTVGSVEYTSGSDLGQALSIDFSGPNSNWWLIQNNPARTSSTSQSLQLRHIAPVTLGITFSTGVQTVGFTMNVLYLNDDWTVNFYSDGGGTNLLTSLTGITGFTDPPSPDLADRAFIGYTNTQGIEYVEIIANTLNSSTASRQFDDLSFVVPEPNSGALLMSAGLLALCRRRSKC